MLKAEGLARNHITYTTYKNTVMPHRSHIYAKAYDMANAVICTYPHSDHALPHCKFLLRCFVDCPYINLPDQETNKKYEETTPSIRFHIYYIIGSCANHGRISLKDKNICSMCKQESSPDKSTKIYTRKELVMMETTISDFHTSYYIPAIQKLAFHLPHVRIHGTNHCVYSQTYWMLNLKQPNVDLWLQNPDANP